MPKSFASSLLPLSAALALALLAAGCGGVKDAHYSPADAQAAFAAVDVSVYGPRQVIPQQVLGLAPAPSLRTRKRPLTAMLEAVRGAVLVSAVSRESRPTVLRGPYVYVFVYPRVEDAERRARSFADILEAEQILHRADFGYLRKGNVVVDYHVYRPGSRVPGFIGEWESTRQLDQKIKRQMTAALAHLE